MQTWVPRNIDLGDGMFGYKVAAITYEGENHCRYDVDDAINKLLGCTVAKKIQLSYKYRILTENIHSFQCTQIICLF